MNIRNDIADSRSWKNRILDQARREATLDLWNITLEMNVLFEKNWTALVNERILQYQNHLLDILLNDSVELNNVTSFPGNYPSNDTTYDSEGKESVRTKLYSFEKQVLQEVRQHGYDGDDDASEAGTVQWSVAGGLLYSLTVITTIGKSFTRVPNFRIVQFPELVRDPSVIFLMLRSIVRQLGYTL